MALLFSAVTVTANDQDFLCYEVDERGSLGNNAARVRWTMQ